MHRRTRRLTLFAALALVSTLTACTEGAAPGASVPDATAEYTVELDPADFVNVIDNPYFPLTPGTTFLYEGETGDGVEHIEVSVTHDTREVLGIRTTVVRDIVRVEGVVVEDTFDWYVQDRDGNVWYFGEDVSNYKDGKLVGKGGSWEAGVDGALPGIIMWADPTVGESYRQEYYEGVAEDMAEVLRLDASATVAYGSFDGLLQTKEWTPLEPDVIEHKYYAPGVGLVLEVEVKGGSERSELMEITRE